MPAVTRLAACALLAAAFSPAASALDRNRLALMPLPKSALGKDAAALSLESDSGVDSNAAAAKHAGGGITAAELARSGRVTGYTLDYVLVSSAARPGALQNLLAVQTIAELYRDTPAAVNGLRFWHDVTAATTASKASGMTVAVSPFEARVGDGAYGFELTYRRAGRTLGHIGDVVFRTGDMLGAVFVTARDEAGLRARTLVLARRLLARIHGVTAGEITGPATALPGKK